MILDFIIYMFHGFHVCIRYKHEYITRESGAFKTNCMCVNVVHCTTKTSTSYCSSLSRPLFLSHSRSSLNPFKVISNHSCSDSMVNTIVFCVTNTVYIAIQKHRRRDFFFPVHLLAVIRRYSPINQNVYWYNDYRFEFDRKRNSFSSYLPFFLSLKHTQQSLTNIIGERWKQTHIFMCSFYSLFFFVCPHSAEVFDFSVLL